MNSIRGTCWLMVSAVGALGPTMAAGQTATPRDSAVFVTRLGSDTRTHFATDRDLVFGTGSDTLVVPVGRYTLFSVPEREGGWLIINEETEQAGTAHDPAQELGRVRMTTRPLATPVELFTIKAETDGGAHLLRLQWDNAERVVPFRVRVK